MGTNYYCRQIKLVNELESEKRIALEAAKNSKLPIKDSEILTEIVNEFYDEKIGKIVTNDVHIGKSSGGWDFLFQLNEKKYYHDKASMIAFIKECQIVDEYDRELDFDTFWNNIVSDRTWNGNPTKRSRDCKTWGHLYTVIDDLEFLDVEFS